MKKLILTIFFSVFFLNITMTYAEHIPEMIKIGLNFGGSAKSSVSLQVNGLDMQAGSIKDNLGRDSSYIVEPMTSDIYIMEESYPAYQQAYLASQIKSLEFGDTFFVVYYDDNFNIGSLNQNSKFDSQIIRSNQGIISVRDTMNNPVLLYDPLSDIRFFSSDNSTIKINSKAYRGAAEFKIDVNHKLTVINTLGIEEYLYGVVPNEMPSSWNKEALKAQAIAARNYAIKNMGKYKSQGFDLCTTQNSQVYGGYESEQKTTNQAVDETRGILAYYENNIAVLFYHSSSGGMTENAENVWSNPVAYLKGVEDSYSLGSPHDNWTYKISKLEVEKILRSKNNDIGDLISIKVDKKSENGRVLELTFKGTLDSVTYQKESIRALFGYSNIKSTYFDLDLNSSKVNEFNSTAKEFDIESIFNDLSAVLNNEPQKEPDGIVFTDTPDEYVFRGKGWGHGLGLSQYGAKNMAESGYTFDQILKHYFTGIQVY